jgi:ribosomal 50S subunit-recycling heat shock protein
MRLDKYLKVSRLIKRRTVANEACDTGRVSINGKTAKPSAEVKEGDVLSVRLGGKIMSVKITSVREFAQKGDAADMYEILPGEAQ